jgi:hypothetical protein
MNTTQSRWFTYVMKWVEGEEDLQMFDRDFPFHKTLDEAKQAVQDRLLACASSNVVGFVERHDYDQYWRDWFTPENVYDPMVIGKNRHNELVVLNKGMGL